MASRTVNVRGTPYRATSDAPINITPSRLFTFTYTPSSVRYDHDILGIAHNDKDLFFCTTRSIGATAQLPQMLQVNPWSGTIQESVSISVGSGSDIVDICHNPWNDHFYAIRLLHGFPDVWQLIELERRGSDYKFVNVITTLPDESRAVCWDTGKIWVNYFTSVYGLARNQAYDPRTGTALFPAAGIAMPSVSYSSGWGIAHTGQNMVVKADPTLFASRTFYTVDPVLHNGGTFAKIQLAAAAVAGDQAPITYDGLLLWDFDMA